MKRKNAGLAAASNNSTPKESMPKDEFAAFSKEESAKYANRNSKKGRQS